MKECYDLFFLKNYFCQENDKFLQNPDELVCFLFGIQQILISC